MFRRRARPLPPDVAAAYEAFHRCAEHVDLGQRAMLRCVPSSARSLALPIEVGAETLRLALDDAAASMDAWRHDLLAAHWDACRASLDEVRAALPNAVAVVSATDELEVALTAVQDLLDPLHAFVDTEEAFRRLR